MTDHIRLFLIDDHLIVRQGLRSILELESGLIVVGEADDTPAALPLIDELRPDIVLLDLSIGRYGPSRGLEACRTITSRFPSMGVIILTTFLEEQLVLQAIQSGAKGYVLKDVDAIDLAKMIRAVHRGEAAIDTRITPLVLKHVAGVRDQSQNPIQWSERERDVIRLLAAGRSNRQIGLDLNISESTVKYHLRNIMDKLNVRARTEVVYAAGKLGLL
jgi:two-component system, NarL family, response regulator DevR